MTTRPGGRARRSTRPLNVPETLIGRVLDGRFRLDHILSAGGMGIVFKAHQLSIERPVAVKLLKPTLSNDMELLQRFFHEVQVVSTLQHPNIVATIDAGKDAGGLAYLVMEYFDGDTFREVLQRFELTLVEICDVFVQVFDALIEAHACDVIHRDLKYDNIMLKRLRDGRLHVKILDFGVAKLLGSDLNLTRGGQVPGTPGIIAPELVDANVPTPQSDLYSLGVLFFTALSGQAPFQAENDLALMHAHKTQPIPPLRPLVGHDVPDVLVNFVNRMLSKDPLDRPVDAKSARVILERIVERLEMDGRSSAYVPPRFVEDMDMAMHSGAFAVQDVDVSLEADAYLESLIEAEQLSEKNKSTPILMPSSIVAALFFLLTSLILVCLFLLYQLFITPT